MDSCNSKRENKRSMCWWTKSHIDGNVSGNVMEILRRISNTVDWYRTFSSAWTSILKKQSMRLSIKFELSKSLMKSFDSRADKRIIIFRKNCEYVLSLRFWMMIWSNPDVLKSVVYSKFWYKSVFDNCWSLHFISLIWWSPFQKSVNSWNENFNEYFGFGLINAFLILNTPISELISWKKDSVTEKIFPPL